MSRRGTNPAAERAAQNQQTIKTLLKLEGNKTCADCKRNKRKFGCVFVVFGNHSESGRLLSVCRISDPRWASWNLGIFVCIRYGIDLLRGEYCS